MILRRLTKAIALIALLAVPGLLLAACGGSGGEEVSADSDPQAVLDRTFGPEGDIVSADMDVSVEIDGGERGSVTASMSGPVADTEGDMPEADIEISLEGNMDGDEVDFSMGMTSTAGKTFLTLDGETYEIDQALAGQITPPSSESGAGEGEESEKPGGLFGDLDLPSVLTDLSNEGTADVDGTETVHVSGTVDTSRAMAEIDNAIAGAGALRGLGVDVPGSRELRELESMIGNITFDVYSGADDGLLRQMDFEMPVSDPEGRGDEGSVKVSITLSDVNEPVEITEPQNARPFMDLIGALGSGALEGLGIDDLGDLGDFGDLGQLFDPQSGGTADGAATDGASADQGFDLESATAELENALDGIPGGQEALDCIQSASSPSEIVQCQELMQ